MFNKIKDYFEKDLPLDVDESGDPTDKDVKLATAVLLLEMAGSDNDYAPEETRTIAKTMCNQFNIEDSEILSLLTEADALRNKEQKIDSFVEAINNSFHVSQKRKVMAMIWKVVVADKEIDKFEERFTTQMKFRLKLTDEDVEEAKALVLRGEV